MSDADIEREAIQAEPEGKLNGSNRRRKSARASPAENDNDDRPSIRMKGGELHDLIEEGAQALRSDDDLYHREGVLVHVTHESHVQFIEGAPRIWDMSIDTLRERLTRSALWLKFDMRSESWSRANPTDQIVRGIAMRRQWPNLRYLTGIIESPSLRPDGSVISTPGYDRPTGYLYAPRMAYPDIPERPTLNDARGALAMLEDVFVDFPHASAACRTMVIAAALTLLARPAIRGATPGFIWDANTPGSGKTLQADSASLIGTGREAGRVGFPTDRRSYNDEVSKVLCAYALMGLGLITFDNLGSELAFGGPALEAVLTAEGAANFRILGANKMITAPWQTVVFGTGNNVVIARDMLRRIMMSRLDSPHEKPEQRPMSDFKHPERAFRLKAWIKENRPALVVAGLTLLRAHALASRPSPSRTWASFETWTKVIADAIVWAGGADPLECRPAEDGEENPEKRSMAVVLRYWGKLDPDGKGITIKTALGCLYPPERLRGEAPPDGFDELREAIEQLVPTKQKQAPDAHALGSILKRYKRSVINGLRFDTLAGRAGVVRWFVLRVQQVVVQAESAPLIGAPSDV
jgi:hypothetical protein